MFILIQGNSRKGIGDVVLARTIYITYPSAQKTAETTSSETFLGIPLYKEEHNTCETSKVAEIS